METDSKRNGAAWNGNTKLFDIRAIDYSPIRKKEANKAYFAGSVRPIETILLTSTK